MQNIQTRKLKKKWPENLKHLINMNFILSNYFNIVHVIEGVLIEEDP